MRLAGKEFSLPGMPAGNQQGKSWKWRGSARSPGRTPHRLPVLVRPTARCHPGANHTRQSGRQDGGVPSPKRARSDLFSRLDYTLFRRNDERGGVVCLQFSAHFRSASKSGKTCIPGPIREARLRRYRLILDRDVARKRCLIISRDRGGAGLSYRQAADPRRRRGPADAVGAPSRPATKTEAKSVVVSTARSSFRDGPQGPGPEAICGRPPARKVLTAWTGLVGCGHMSGLSSAVGVTAGPDGLRGSGPKHERDV
jgi:hypothetical protein